MNLNLVNVIINDGNTPVDLSWNGNYQIGLTGTPGVGVETTDRSFPGPDTYSVITTIYPGESVDIFGDNDSQLVIQDEKGFNILFWTKQFAFIVPNLVSVGPGQDPSFIQSRTQFMIQKVLQYPDTQLLSLLVQNPMSVLFQAGIFTPPGATITIVEEEFRGSTPLVLNKANENFGQTIYNLQIKIQVPPPEPPQISPWKHIGAKALWWGYQIYLDETATQVVTGTVAGDIEKLIEDIVAEIPEVGSIIKAIITAYFDIENEAIKSADQGNGVTLSACWLSPVLLVPTPIKMGK